MRNTREYWHIIRDLVVMGGLLAGVNLLVDSADFGWFLINPTPWLLPAALIGARYGFAAGLVSGLAVAATIAGVNSHRSHEGFADVIRGDAYFHLAIVVVGGVAGEIGTLLGQRKKNLASRSRHLEEENLRLRSQLNLLDETRLQLQQQLAVYNAPLCSLDADLRALLAHPETEFEDQLLRLLHRCTGVSSAGIYVKEGGSLNSAALLHPTAFLQKNLHLHNTPLAERAISTGSSASVASVSSLTTRQPFLAAFPWNDEAGRTIVLLIQDMPLEAFSQQNLARIQTILTWATAMSVLQRSFRRVDASQRTISESDFKAFVTEALHMDRDHGLPSALVRLDTQASGGSSAVLARLPGSAIATALPDQRSIGVLFPFSGGSEADVFVREVLHPESTQAARHHVVTGDTTAELLWQQLTAA